MTACQCQTRRDSAEAALTERGTYRAVLRKAGAELRYPARGAVEFAPVGDLGEIAVGVAVEREHDGPTIGKVVGVERSDSELIVEIELAPGETAEVGDHVSADYDVGSVDSDGAQRGVKIKTLALVSRGRCGSECSVLRSDGMTTPAEKAPAIPENKTPAAPVMDDTTKARLDAAEKEIAGLRRQRSAQIRKDAAGALARAGVKVGPARKDADDAAVMASTVAKIAPSVALDGASPDFVAGAFAVAIAMVLEKADLADSKEEPAEDAPPADGPPAAAGASDARADAFEARKDRQDAEERPASLGKSPDQIARDKMIQRSDAFQPTPYKA